MHEVFLFVLRKFKSYWLFREYTDLRRAKIYNATPNSYIDAFEQKGLSSKS